MYFWHFSPADLTVNSEIKIAGNGIQNGFSFGISPSKEFNALRDIEILTNIDGFSHLPPSEIISVKSAACKENFTKGQIVFYLNFSKDSLLCR